MTCCLFLVALLWNSLPGGAVAAEQQRITLVFRYDDYGECSKSARSDFEVKLVQAFRSFGLSATFAVIPYRGPQGSFPSRELVPLSASKAGLLADLVNL